MTKTTEQITEEFFTVEREEYEKREPKAFPRVPVKAREEKQDGGPEPAEVTEKTEDEQKPAGKTTN